MQKRIWSTHYAITQKHSIAKGIKKIMLCKDKKVRGIKVSPSNAIRRMSPSLVEDNSGSVQSLDHHPLLA
jgi:hypothetical protein